MKRKYFHNNWQAIKDTPDKHFASMPYEQFEDWKIYGYVLPSTLFCLIRTKGKDGKIEEFAYSTERGSRFRLNKAMEEKKEVYVCTMEGMYHLKPDNLPLDFNNNEPENI